MLQLINRTFKTHNVRLNRNAKFLFVSQSLILYVI
jgi:hypothetical protein